MPSLIAAATILALAPTAQAAEPVTLDDTQLDAVIAGSKPGTTVDDILWEYGGDDVYGPSSDVSLGDGDETYEAFDVNIQGFFNFN